MGFPNFLGATADRRVWWYELVRRTDLNYSKINDRGFHTESDNQPS